MATICKGTDLAFLGDLASSLFSSPDQGQYAQDAAQQQQQAEQDRQRAIQAQAQQSQLAQYLQAAMLGGAPSVAQNQLMMGLEANRRQQDSMSSGVSGPGSALARYGAAMNTGNAAADTNQQSALLRAQELNGYRQQLAGLYNNQAQTSANLYGTGTSAALGYSGQGLQNYQGNAGRQQQQEGAILTGGGSMLAGLYSGRSGSSGDDSSSS